MEYDDGILRGIEGPRHGQLRYKLRTEDRLGVIHGKGAFREKTNISRFRV
jgi:hypothetical protein